MMDKNKRYIIFPVHVNPTKPMNPSHIRHILYADFLFKQLKLRFGGENVKYSYNRLAHDTSTQVIKLSEYLKKNNIRVSTELDVGRAYVNLHLENNFNLNRQFITERVEQLETNLQGHEYYDAILPSWEEQHEYLKLHTPNFESSRKYNYSPLELIEDLNRKGMLLSSKTKEVINYLDFTDKGLPLRALITGGEYGYNYIFNIIRQLLEDSTEGDTVILIFDPEVSSDFNLIRLVLESFGRNVISEQTARFKIRGKIASARKGGWIGYTLQDIIDRFSIEYSRNDIAFGLRLYFLAFNSISSSQLFSFSELEKTIKNASKINRKLGDVNYSNYEKDVIENMEIKKVSISYMEFYKSLLNIIRGESINNFSSDLHANK